ncbi:MAG: sulfatase-like hydrolase/transferase [Planctomycetes bacterium]|nr:sulfatase-like hydrolase/transferase [Planctomycetota bacterium]MBL7145925.1 sulfatase-like hydrolase/transferase [Phycisphaerae bacterium]
MNRRDFLKTLSFGAAALVIQGCSGASGFSPGKSKRHNIILIMADDIGYECFGCYGSASYKTPVLDGMAAAGMRFEHCYSQPLCTPSRVKIMTGQYNFRNYTNFGVLDPKQKTFGHLLQGCGYATCVVGKWQLYGSVNQSAEVRGAGSMPAQAGFDEHCLWQVKERGSRYKDPVVVQNGRNLEGLEGRYGPDVFCDYAIDFIERHKAKPFFLYFPMAIVHNPFVPTPDSQDWEQEKQKNDNKYFADMVTYMDKIVGRIVARVDELGLSDNTLVIFTGDNGTNKDIKSKMSDGQIIKGDKGNTTDAGTRVPLIARWPGEVPAGKVCGDLVDFSDFVPTFAEMTGASPPEGMIIDGQSFLPQLRGKQGKPRKWIFCHYDPKWLGRKEAVRFVRDKRWKLYGNGNLFDVPTDTMEQNPNPSGPEAASARKQLQDVLDSIE